MTYRPDQLGQFVVAHFKVSNPEGKWWQIRKSVWQDRYVSIAAEAFSQIGATRCSSYDVGIKGTGEGPCTYIWMQMLVRVLR